MKVERVESVEVGGVVHRVQCLPYDNGTRGRVYLNGKPVEDHGPMSLAAALDNADLLKAALHAANLPDARDRWHGREVESHYQDTKEPEMEQEFKVGETYYNRRGTPFIFVGTAPLGAPRNSMFQAPNATIDLRHANGQDVLAEQRDGDILPAPPQPSPTALAAAAEIANGGYQRGWELKPKQVNDIAAIIDSKIGPYMKAVAEASDALDLAESYFLYVQEENPRLHDDANGSPPCKYAVGKARDTLRALSAAAAYRAHFNLEVPHADS